MKVRLTALVEVEMQGQTTMIRLFTSAQEIPDDFDLRSPEAVRNAVDDICDTLEKRNFVYFQKEGGELFILATRAVYGIHKPELRETTW